MPSSSNKIMAALAIVLCAAFLIFVLFNAFSKQVTDSAQLPLLVVGSVVVIIGALALFAISFALMDMSNKDEAFGLPSGSIRALVAISLIVIFAVISIYLYSSLSTTTLVALTGLDTASKDAVLKLPDIYNPIVAPETDNKFTVHFWQGKSQSSQDFAKQLLIMLGTLVTSIASFYFGTATVKSSTTGTQSQDNPAPIVLKKISVTTFARPAQGNAPLNFDLFGDILDQLKELKLELRNTPIPVDFMKKESASVACKVVITSTTQTGDWNLIAIDKAGRRASLDHALTIT